MKGTCTKKSIGALICIMLAAVLSAYTLTGCGLFFNPSSSTLTSIKFSQKSLSLKVGETYNLADLLTYSPASVLNVEVVLTSSDTSVVSTNGHNITATSSGTAVITATASGNVNIYDKITVKTAYSEADYTVIYDGDLTQIYGEATPITFSVDMDSSANPEYILNTEWYVSDVKQEGGAAFKYTPKDIGTTTVYAKTTVNGETITSEVFNVTVYSAEMTGSFTVTSGSLVQADVKSAVVFTATVGNEGEQTATIIWKVNGVTEQSSISKTFSFIPPRPGDYIITAYLNNDKNQMNYGDTAQSATVSYTAPIEIENVRVSFDNVYPHVYLLWSDPGVDVDYEVTISSVGTETQTYLSSNQSHAEYFDGNSFDLSLPTVNSSPVFSLGARGNTLITYTVTLRSVGDAQGKNTSALTTIRQRQIDSTAARYWSDVIITNKMDKYLTSDSEANELTRYMIEAEREQANSSSRRYTFNAYVAYSNSVCNRNGQIFENYFTKYAKLSYNLSQMSTSVSNSVLTATYVASYANIPTRSAQGTINNGGTVMQRRTFITPAINYPGIDDGLADRAADFDGFAINSLDATMSVSNSTQLYYAADNDARPIPVEGSRAEIIYNNAKAVARQIISDDMTDAEKAIAIYEWVGYRNVYDYNSANTSGDLFMDYAASYLESIFYTNEAYDDGFRPYTICAGYTAAYSLLCAIEGIPCNAVMGDGHIWNEVYISEDPAYIDGWYLVDVTFCQVNIDISAYYNDNIYDAMQSHSYILVSDRQMSVSHKTNSANYSPTVADGNQYYKNTYLDEEENYDRYLSNSDFNALNISNQASAIVDYILREENRVETVQIPGGNGVMENLTRRIAMVDMLVESASGSGQSHYNTYKERCENLITVIRSTLAERLNITVNEATQIIRFTMTNTIATADINAGLSERYVFCVCADLPALNALVNA